MWESRNAFALLNKPGLDVAEHRVDAVGGGRQRHAELLAFLARPIAPGDHARLLLDVFRPQLDAHWHAAQFPFVEPEARRLVEVGVHLHCQRLVAVELVARPGAQFVGQLVGRGQ